MELNADYSKRAVVHAARIDWVPSPMPGVERRMLDRIGGEVARATSIVHYLPGRQFSPHVHGGGDFLVLGGDFEEARECFEPLSWLRLPMGTTLEATAGPAGCKVWVKSGHVRYAPQP
jgi:anti-sigma factor ChrR (cupin superfamily)